MADIKEDLDDDEKLVRVAIDGEIKEIPRKRLREFQYITSAKNLDPHQLDEIFTRR